MERDDIIKALECCTYGGDFNKSQVEVCSPCPYFHEGNCTDVLKENALSLINELTEENERVKLEYAGFEAGAKHAVSFVKSDTVRKMHSEIEKRCIKGGIYPAFAKSTINKIAKEMLEVAERREGVEESPVDSSTPSVTDQKGEGK